MPYSNTENLKVVVTGSSGHLGEAMVRTLREQPVKTIGIDITPSPFTSVVGTIVDPDCVEACMDGVNVVYHTATLHKPHVATHSMQKFIDTNITGTRVLLEAAVAAGVDAFIFTSTTSTFGEALQPPRHKPATWVTEDIKPIPKNIYGVTKTAAEDLCHLFHRLHGLNCIVLRTSRFFPEEDDNRSRRQNYEDANLKANEFLFRRVELEDVVSAHLAASQNASRIGFGRYIISATTPFFPEDLVALRTNAPDVVQTRIPGYRDLYSRLGWKMFSDIDRVYVNAAARADLGWQPKYDFAHVIACLERGEDFRSPLTKAVGAKGYHNQTFEDGPYPVMD